MTHARGAAEQQQHCAEQGQPATCESASCEPDSGARASSARASSKRAAGEQASSAASPQQAAAEQRERKRQARKRARRARRLRQQPNTSVYVTGLPRDVTAPELAAFCAKCGILLPDARTGLPRVKIYRDERGDVKGDALVTYALRASVDNALQLLDGAFLRDGRCALSVSEASFEHKRARVDSGGDGDGDGGGGDGVAAAERAHEAPRVSRQLFVQEKMRWHDDELDERSVPNASRMVILKNVFDARTADYDVIRGDMREGCGECGDVDKLTVFERNAEGAVAVKFKTIEACLKCIQVMNGRWYDGRQLRAQFYDGHSDYRYKETHAEREQRDRQWQQWLEQSDTHGDQSKAITR